MRDAAQASVTRRDIGRGLASSSSARLRVVEEATAWSHRSHSVVFDYRPSVVSLAHWHPERYSHSIGLAEVPDSLTTMPAHVQHR